MYKVLLVEDEDIIRTGLKYTIDWVKADCIVIGEAVNGIDGLEKIEKLEPDIVFLDVNMPVMNGIEMLANAHDTSIFSTIIISGYDDFKYAQSAIKYGVSEYLLKPVDHSQLYEALEKAKESVEHQRKVQLIEEMDLSSNSLEAITSQILKNPLKGSAHVKSMIEYIEENYSHKISITDLVEPLDMSVTYLNSKFKEETGYTFNEFLNRYRITKAIERIMLGEEKITNIALEVGFGNYRYFSQVFKKFTKALPSDFQNYFKRY